MRVTLIRADERNEEYVRDRGEFSTTVPSGEIPRLAIAFVSFGEGLQWMGLQERGSLVANYVRRLRISELVEVEPPLDLAEIAAAMPGRSGNRLGWGPLPARTSEDFLAAVGRLRPDLVPVIARLRERGTDTDLGGRGYEIAAMEKDGIGLAMGIQGLDRAPLRRWRQGRQAAGFMQGLEGVTLREDQIVNHDLRVFEGWRIVEESAVGAVRYEQDGASLTVVNVNRTPVEEALGVDLVYHHERFESFVLVQYKRMQGTGAGQVYRPDAGLDRELNLMRQVRPRPPDPVDQFSYRLGPGVCYLKLCKAVVLDPYSKSLIDGMYLPLEYFDACAPTALGPRGGRAYGYSTVPRHFNNTQFTQLVQDGWIGSNGVLSDRLRRVVEELVARGDSVLLATGAGRRRRPIRR